MRVLWAWEVADEAGYAGVAVGTILVLGSGRWIVIGRCRLRDGIGGLGIGQRIGIGPGGLGSSGGPERPYSDIPRTPGEVSRLSRSAEVRDGDAWVRLSGSVTEEGLTSAG